MRIKDSIPTLVLLSSYLLAGNALAASVAGNVVYEKVDMFRGAVHFTDSFMIDSAGTYKATLTDFAFPNAFDDSGLNVTSSTASLGRLSGPGDFTFEAGPGDYYVSMFAEFDRLGVSAEEKHRLINEEQKRRGDEWWHSLTKEEQREQKALWQSWTKEELAAHQKKVRRRAERQVEKQLDSLNLGQYGIQIALLDGPLATVSPQAGVPVPLPAAIWLFGSGLLGVAALGRRSAKG